jgi:hypothetical protein
MHDNNQRISLDAKIPTRLLIIVLGLLDLTVSSLILIKSIPIEENHPDNKLYAWMGESPHNSTHYTMDTNEWYCGLLYCMFIFLMILWACFGWYFRRHLECISDLYDTMIHYISILSNILYGYLIMILKFFFIMGRYFSTNNDIVNIHTNKKKRKTKKKGKNTERSNTINCSCGTTSKCIICEDLDINCLILPCRHHISCVTCTGKLKNCPMCRAEIKETLKTYGR